MKPSILILHASGTNRDEEAARACELAGGQAEVVHINRMRAGERRMSDYDMLLLPGGFSYGDALGAGVRLALDLRVYLQDQLLEFAYTGKPILGICNGFQALVKSGLLPGTPAIDTSSPSLKQLPRERNVTLGDNAQGQFECRWVTLLPNASSASPFIREVSESIFCPIAHGEGRFRVSDETTLQALKDNGCIAFQYGKPGGTLADGEYPYNPNGSDDDIAGICNPAGNVVGLMPHPEDHIVDVQSPARTSGNLGLQLFTAMIGSI